MTHSLAQEANVTCPKCGQSFSDQVWLIVDIAERPDLAQRIRDGTIHTTHCPYCGNEVEIDAPLLIYDPERQRVLFSPPWQTSEEEDRQIGEGLLSHLAESFLNHAPDYLGQALGIPRESLSILLDADDLQAALDLTAIVHELSQLKQPSEMPHPIQLCRRALDQVERTAQPQLWAVLQVELGISLAQNPLDDRAENIELTIEHYKQALEVRIRQAMPVEWAETMMNLGNAYLDRIRGDRTENCDPDSPHSLPR
jgi:hypothetical protein